MTRFTRPRNAAGPALLLLMLVCQAAGQRQPTPASAVDRENPNTEVSAKRAAYRRAFVIDDRLSALRRGPGLQAEVIRRLRPGHAVFIITATKPRAGQPGFCRIAVTRRTRGWIHEAALAVQGRAGEDRRIVKLIESISDGLDRILLCRVLIERFSQSRLVPKALLTVGEEAERAGKALNQRARKRLAEVVGDNANASSRDYFMNDVGLDRYSKLHIVFDFNESTSEYVYDGRAYRELVRRFPDVEEAKLARQRLELARQKMAGRQ
jgi:hypothetical protein